MIKGQIEILADQIRRIFCDTIPVSVLDICKQLDIFICFEDIRSEAYLLCEGGKASIIVKRNADDKRSKFSIAHELGHFFIPEHSKAMFSCTQNDMSYRTNKQIEIEANLFASQLVMPSQLLKMDVKGDINLDFIVREAAKFDVSLSAMSIRLAQLAFDSIAVFYIKEGNIIWSIKSREFELPLIANSSRISPFSISSQLFEEEKHQTKSGEVSANCWLDSTDIDNVFEEAMYFPNYKSALAIVHYNPEDIETYDKEDY